jgi:erythritol kinase (D-erythritol 1-phosphate-forming)
VAVLCIDVGTSVIKTVAFDESGRELGLARREATVSRPHPGWAEQDMEEVWDAVVATGREVAGALDEPVGLIAFTAQGDGCWLVDAEGRPTGPAILWNDGRANALVERWQRDGLLEQAFARNRSLGFAGLPSAILAWLREHDRERLERSATALYCDGWLFLRLTGERAVGISDASAPFLDVRTGDYAPELLELYGLEWARELLPEVRTQEGSTGELGAAAAEALGLDPGLPVVMAPYDIVATAIGVGAVAPGQACSVLGTTLCTELVLDALPDDEAPSGLTIALGGERWMRAFPTLAGGEVVLWAGRELGLGDPGELSALAGDAPLGAGGLWFLPYLAPAGERAPFLEPAARGTLLGLSLEHDRSHVARAVLEGLSLVVRDCLEASGARGALEQIGLCGGGAASDVWCQLIADACGVPAFRTKDAEVGARGAFLCGLVATGAEPDLPAAAERHVEVGDTFAPDPERAAAYDERHAEFLALRELAVEQWRRMARFAEGA